jgi:hypothetical protein
MFGVHKHVPAKMRFLLLINILNPEGRKDRKAEDEGINCSVKAFLSR